MPTIAEQLKRLRKQINIPYTIQFVDREIKPSEFEGYVIYVHIWI